MTLPSYAMNVSSFPEMYERFLVGPLFRPWAEALLDEARVAPGERVLDIACGTGIVARLAKERGAGSVTGVDLSPGMVAEARRAAPAIDWREGDAAALPLGDGEQFDLVVCQQGLQFFGDKAAAAREMLRALAPGGRAIIATWRPLPETPFLAELHRIAQRHLGPVTDQRHSFGEAGPLAALLREAGFGTVQVKTLARTVRFDDGDVFLRLNAMALVGMSAASKNMDDAARNRAAEAIAADSQAAAAPRREGAALAYELLSNVAIARR
jgi:ubiquinone/menaquinone biosynthesis C-methylase UbiE